jgi:hypothetical protein
MATPKDGHVAIFFQEISTIFNNSLQFREQVANLVPLLQLIGSSLDDILGRKRFAGLSIATPKPLLLRHPRRERSPMSKLTARNRLHFLERERSTRRLRGNFGWFLLTCRTR